MNDWRLGHRPALDGLRGVAILLVVAYHGFVLLERNMLAVASMGVVGVTLFFTLSGFLITSLLLDEHQRTGRINLRAFYRRRAYRLFPALAGLVVISAALTLLIPGYVSIGGVVATVLYVQNWFLAFGGAHDGLGHAWSLAIEEQFYIVWPIALIALLRFGRRAVFGVAAVAALASFAWRSELAHHAGVGAWRLLGTDSRADGLLIGCALAVVVRRLPVQRSLVHLVAIGVGGFMLLASIPMTGYDYNVTAPFTAAIGAALVIYGVMQERGWRPLQGPVLRWFGRRSYGLYLWHMAVFAVLAHWLAPGLVMLVLYVAGSLLLAEVSWRFVEQPFLRQKGGVKPQTLRLRKVAVAAKVTNPM